MSNRSEVCATQKTSVMSVSVNSLLEKKLEQRKALHRMRKRSVLYSPQGASVDMMSGLSEFGDLDNKTPTHCFNFCSNDYLGLANHPKLVEAFGKAAKTFGVGSGASHLVCGHSSEHHALEEELAEFTGRDRAVLFSTGYMANLGVMSALLEKNDAVFQDKLNHASLLDGGLHSPAKLYRYAHNDMNHLEQRLMKNEARLKLIASDGVFSMDGDIANVKTLAKISNKHNTLLMIDDAHGFGALGERGAGVLEAQALSQEDVPILMGTLGKAFGSFGAFVCGSELVVESIIQFARTYVYTTALPPAVAAASRAALMLVQEEPWRREHLRFLIKTFRQGAEALNLQLMPSDTAIQPLLVGKDQDALALSQVLMNKGFWVSAIRPPTVAEGTARLRFTFTANHSLHDIERLLDSLAQVRMKHSHWFES